VLRYLVDENVHADIIRALLRRRPDLELLTIQDAGWRAVADPLLLERAAEDRRVVISSDLSTLIGYAYARVRVGQTMPGLFVVRQRTAIGVVIEDLLLLAAASDDGEWEGQVLFLPF
jgi:hypothetical protein